MRRNWREHMLRQVALDPARTHFLGRMPRSRYLAVLQVSAAHVYLTYPFVLSWSLLEAMACGTPIVASDTAPVREVLRQRENALLVPFHSRRRAGRGRAGAARRAAAIRRDMRAPAAADARRFDPAAALKAYDDPVGGLLTCGRVRSEHPSPSKTGSRHGHHHRSTTQVAAGARRRHRRGGGRGRAEPELVKAPGLLPASGAGAADEYEAPSPDAPVAGGKVSLSRFKPELPYKLDPSYFLEQAEKDEKEAEETLVKMNKALADVKAYRRQHAAGPDGEVELRPIMTEVRKRFPEAPACRNGSRTTESKVPSLKGKLPSPKALMDVVEKEVKSRGAELGWSLSTGKNLGTVNSDRLLAPTCRSCRPASRCRSAAAWCSSRSKARP